MDKRELENLCNDFSNASQLLEVMQQGVWAYSGLCELNDNNNPVAGYFHEISYALAFVSDALKDKANALWKLLEDVPNNY